ncbi:MAG TPA: hypothetical protein VFX89_10910 [Gammaproteobacteria bacterium]|nr:hypothetical protein [Gammaproteobacteria bacterium]
MSTRQFTFRTSGNPLVQALWMVVGIALLVAAVIMGALVVTVLLAVGVVAAAVFAVRVWWLRRKLEREGAFGASPGPSGEGAAERHEPQLIEAEYTVVSERDPPDADPAKAGEREAREARERANRRASR